MISGTIVLENSDERIVIEGIDANNKIYFGMAGRTFTLTTKEFLYLYRHFKSIIEFYGLAE